MKMTILQLMSRLWLVLAGFALASTCCIPPVPTSSPS